VVPVTPIFLFLNALGLFYFLPSVL
jgi:hypothetical protein